MGFRKSRAVNKERRKVEEIFFYGLRQKHECAEQTERLAERSHGNIGNPTGNAAASFPQGAKGMRFIHNTEKTVTVLKPAKPVNIQKISIHTEKGFGDNSRLSFPIPLQPPAQVRHGIVVVSPEGSPAQLHPLDTARVDTFVENQGIALFEKGGKESEICLVAAGKEKGTLIAEVAGMSLLGLGYDFVVAGSEPR